MLIFFTKNYKSQRGQLPYEYKMDNLCSFMDLLYYFAIFYITSGNILTAVTFVTSCKVGFLMTRGCFLAGKTQVIQFQTCEFVLFVHLQ